MATRLGPLFFLLTLLARCGSGGGSGMPLRTHVVPMPMHAGPHRLVVLHRGQTRTFSPGSLRAGDVVVCNLAGSPLRIRIPNRPFGGWAVGTAAATNSGNSAELDVRSKTDGSITASCGHKTS